MAAIPPGSNTLSKLTMSEAPKTKPHAEPIYLASVYECESPAAADAMLGGQMPGYVYSRDGHPNAASLAEQCRVLHQADRAAVTNSGMSAMALALVTQCTAGDH